MEDARGLFGRMSTAVQKIVKREKTPKQIVASLQQFLVACPPSVHFTSSRTVIPLSSSVPGGSPHTPPAANNAVSLSAATLGNGASELNADSIPNITPDLEQAIAIIYGDGGEGASLHRDPDPKQAKEMIDLLIEYDVLAPLFEQIKSIEFEGRKYYTRIVEHAISQRRDIAVDYVEHRPAFLHLLVQSYDEKDVSIALCGDAILRACILCESICETMFNAKPSLVQPFFKYVELPNFDISSHAYDTLKLMLTTHPIPASNYLRENYTSFFASYNQLLQSDNFIVKVHAFNLLSLLLFERSNHDVMMKYVNDPDHLRIAMIQLRHPNKALQLAVFNVLKVFIPNPFKADSIVRILTANKKNFLQFLAEFEKESKDDVLICHKKEMIDAFHAMDESTLPSRGSGGSGGGT